MHPFCPGHSLPRGPLGGCIPAVPYKKGGKGTFPQPQGLATTAFLATLNPDQPKARKLEISTGVVAGVEVSSFLAFGLSPQGPRQ